MATSETLQMLAQHAEWIAPRSDVRVFLGEPGGPEATKTTVEPGNVFSPGMRTYGVTWWLRFPRTGDFFASETAPLDALHWSYEQGYLPLIHYRYTLAPSLPTRRVLSGLDVQHSLFQDGTAAQRSEAACARLRLSNNRRNTVRVQVFVAVRSLGPAGGPIGDLTVGPDNRSFWLAERQVPILGLDQAPDAIGCGVGDPSPLAREGRVPPARSAQDAAGWCFGLARFDVRIAAGASWTVCYDCPVQSFGRLQRELPATVAPRPEQFAVRAQAHLDNWRRRFAHLQLDVPDSRFRDAFYAGLQHMLTAVVHNQARITPLFYPLPWLRDSVYIVRCFDLAGWHDLARAASDIFVRHDFLGGFGPEADAPGQGIWALVQHYRLTGDKLWLSKAYPAIKRKCDWLFRMRQARQPLSAQTDTPVFPTAQAERNAGVICLPARDGLIMGVMDGGVEHAIGWVNHWAACGLREAAFAARELGLIMDAAVFDTEADDLIMAVERHAAEHPEFFDLERTVSSLLWPTRAWDEAPSLAGRGFDAWWSRHRGGENDYRPEHYWLYFELAQAHNALLLGQRAWQAVRHRLEHQDVPGLYGWREGGQGVGTRNAIEGVSLIPHLRGCQRVESIAPHGWVQAEMWLLQRAMLVEEWEQGLLLFAGVPDEWLLPGARLAFGGFPTWYGVMSAELQVNATGRSALVVVSGVREGVPVRVRLGRQVQAEVVVKADGTTERTDSATEGTDGTTERTDSATERTDGATERTDGATEGTDGTTERTDSATEGTDDIMNKQIA